MRWLVLLACLGCNGKKQDCPPVKAVVVENTDGMRKQVDEDLRAIDAELDCPRLGKASAPDLVPIQSALLTLKRRAVPQPIGEALHPMIALYDENQGLLSGPSPKIEALCQAMRESLAKVRQDTASLWAPPPIAAGSGCR